MLQKFALRAERSPGAGFLKLRRSASSSPASGEAWSRSTSERALSFTELSYDKGDLVIDGYSGELALHNLPKVEKMDIRNVSHISLTELSKLKSLKSLLLSRCNITWHGLQDLAWLEELSVADCGNFFPWPIEAAHTIKPFPASLRRLEIEGESGMQSMALLSDLTCLTSLKLVDCENLKLDRFNPLIKVNLDNLAVYNTDISADQFSELVVGRTNLLLPGGSFQLGYLAVDSISVVLVAPICSLLAATLQCVQLRHDQRAESFTEEEDRALQLLTSLSFIRFVDCPNLSSLPQGLHSLPSLGDLWVEGCPQIRSLPKGAFPTSLESLTVMDCSPELKKQIEKLKGTNLDCQVMVW